MQDLKTGIATVTKVGRDSRMVNYLRNVPHNDISEFLKKLLYLYVKVVLTVKCIWISAWRTLQASLF